MPFHRITFVGHYASLERKREWWLHLIYGGLFGLLDCLLFSGASFAILKVVTRCFSEPIVLGFNCNDESIKSTYLHDTINVNAVIYVILIATPIIIVLLETYLCHLFNGATTKMAQLTRACTFEYIKFMLGMTASLATTLVLKVSAGRLRPHFLAVCKPDPTKVDCRNGTYFADAHCTGDPNLVRAARQSMPSGHSNAVMYQAVYVSIYFYRMYTASRSWYYAALTIVIWVLLMIWTVIVLVTRFTDHKHHLDDIFAGSGLAIAFVHLTNALFKWKNHYENSLRSDADGSSSLMQNKSEPPTA